MAELSIATEVIIHQKAQIEEKLLGCQFPNRYYVFTRNPSQGHKLLFKCKEQSGCCQRNYCAPNMRGFLMDIKHVVNAGCLDDNFASPFVRAIKPFKCTCFCLERPEMIASFNEGNVFGKIKQPFSCSVPIFTIHDETNALKYFIGTDCRQCGYCCGNCTCGKFSEAVFNIYKDQSMGEVIGTIIKKVATFSELITNANSYIISFPRDANPKDKLLLIIAGLMIDYQCFENESVVHQENHGPEKI